MADTRVLEALAVRRAGSIPVPGTMQIAYPGRAEGYRRKNGGRFGADAGGSRSGTGMSARSGRRVGRFILVWN